MTPRLERSRFDARREPPGATTTDSGATPPGTEPSLVTGVTIHRQPGRSRRTIAGVDPPPGGAVRPAVYPADWLFRNEPPVLSDFGSRWLAEGDSWFTVGTLNLPDATNLLQELEVSTATVIVHCAYPGDTLRRMVDGVNDPLFDRLLWRPRFASYWEAIVLSAGGNDLIEALAAPVGSDPAERLLHTLDEIAAVHGSPDEAGAWISEPGWARFAAYLRTNLAQVVARRDRGPSRGRPLCLHTYARPTVRPAGAISRQGGWIHPALVRAGVPEVARQPLCDRLFGRLRDLLLAADADRGGPDALPAVHVFDSAGLQDLVAAQPATTGPSGDWVNEIHLGRDGLRKVGLPFGRFIEAVLARQA